MDDLFLVGRVARAHGNRGQVVVNLETDFPAERFIAGRVLHVGPSAHPRRIVSVRFHQGRPVIELDGIDTMDAAEGLAGAELKLPMSERHLLPPGTFYHDELLDCQVRTRGGEEIGRVTAVEGPMDRSHLVVAGRNGDVLIPLVADICVAIDPVRRTIVVDPPDGLIDLNRGIG